MISWSDLKIYYLIHGELLKIPGMRNQLLAFAVNWAMADESTGSILLHAIVENPTYSPLNKGEGMQRADFEAIGSLSFVQLSELRHRGAFTSVAQTFAACCLRCAKNVDSEISHLPNLWYQVRRFF